MLGIVLSYSMDETDTIELSKSIKIAFIAGGIGLVLVVLILIQYSIVKNREGEIVLPAGENYLGPESERRAEEAAQAPPPAAAESPKLFTATEGEVWVTITGNIYPYTFESPQSLTLTTFDDDPYDIYAINWGGLNPSSTVLIGVDNLNNKEENQQYIAQQKRAYVENWWRQFGGLSGVSTIEEFTNSNGMRGYRARFLDTNKNPAPLVDMFFEVPGRQDLVIHLSNGILAEDVFERIIDTIGWNGGTQ